MTRTSESLRQIAASNRKLSWLEGTAVAVEKMEKDLEKYAEMGLKYEAQLARKDAIIAELNNANELIAKWLRAEMLAGKPNCTTDGKGDAE